MSRSSAEPKRPAAPASLTGAEKVAVLLLALGKPRAAKLLEALRCGGAEAPVRSSVGDLRPVSIRDLEALVEEFGQKFSSGVNFVGTANEVKRPAVRRHARGAARRGLPTSRSPRRATSRSGSKISQDQGRGAARLPEQGAPADGRLHPVAGSTRRLAAKVVSSFPARQRNEPAVPHARHQARCRRGAGRASRRPSPRSWLASSASGSHAGIADILNRLDKTQSDDRAAKPRRGAARRCQGAQEHALHASRTWPTCRARRARPCSTRCRSSGWCSRSRAPTPRSRPPSSPRSPPARGAWWRPSCRAAASAPARDVAEARRAIVDTVLKMIAKGEIAAAGSRRPRRHRRPERVRLLHGRGTRQGKQDRGADREEDPRRLRARHRPRPRARRRRWPRCSACS